MALFFSQMEQDENAQLPAGFHKLISGQIFSINKISESVASSESSLLQTNLRRSLTENLTPNRVNDDSSAFFYSDPYPFIYVFFTLDGYSIID